MKRVVVVCNTLFQLMVAVHLRHSLFQKDEVDLVCSNHSADGLLLADRAAKAGLFNNVFYVENKKSRHIWERPAEAIKNYFLARHISKRNVYDVVLIANVSIFTILLFNRQLKQNSQVSLRLYEEGLSTYCKSFAQADTPRSLHRKLVNRQGVFAYVTHFYLFHEELLQWSLPNAQVVHLQPMDGRDPRFLEQLEALFHTSEMTDTYDRKYLFFEESHFAEGFEVPDVQIVESMAQKVGKEKIMVKIHPRNKVNRFKQLGYKTNTQTGIPWEAIVLTRPMEDKVLVTISSGAVLYPFLYFGLKMPSISLLNTLEEKPGYMKGDLGQLMQHVYGHFPDVFAAPDTFQNFLKLL